MSTEDEPTKAMPPKEGPSHGRTADKGLAAWLMEISCETAPLMNDGCTSKELMDELYDDETGLAK
jgi:hypothetical protein